MSIPPAPSIDTFPLLEASISTPVCPSNTRLAASLSTVKLPAVVFIVLAAPAVWFNAPPLTTFNCAPDAAYSI